MHSYAEPAHVRDAVLWADAGKVYQLAYSELCKAFRDMYHAKTRKRFDVLVDRFKQRWGTAVPLVVKYVTDEWLSSANERKCCMQWYWFALCETRALQWNGGRLTHSVLPIHGSRRIIPHRADGRCLGFNFDVIATRPNVP